MLVTKSDFIKTNELIYPLDNRQEIDYFVLVKGNAKQGAEDDDITQDEYIHSRLVFGFKFCTKLRTKTNYELFLKTKPTPKFIAEVMQFDSNSIKYLEPHFTMPDTQDQFFDVMMIYPESATLDNFQKLIEFGSQSTPFFASEVFKKYPELHTIKGLGLWVGSKPLVRHIEEVLTNVPISHNKLIIKLYTMTKGDKTYAPIVKEVADKIGCSDLIKGYKQDTRW